MQGWKDQPCLLLLWCVRTSGVHRNGSQATYKALGFVHSHRLSRATAPSSDLLKTPVGKALITLTNMINQVQLTILELTM